MMLITTADTWKQSIDVTQILGYVAFNLHAAKVMNEWTPNKNKYTDVTSLKT